MIPLAPPAAGLPLHLFDYALPEERIAQEPVEPRDSSRLLHLRPDGAVEDRWVTELPTLLREGDLVVANETRVRTGRLRGVGPGGVAAEVLLISQRDDRHFTALVRPGRRLRVGAVVEMGEGLRVRVIGSATGHPGARWVELESPSNVDAALAAVGEVPLPPYTRCPLADPDRYQTLYAAGPPASAAAPTAGLHLTERVRQGLERAGVAWATIRLDIGLGTFTPIRVDDVHMHRMHAERCEVPEATVAAVAATRVRGGRVVAVGTTVVRTLEALTGTDGLQPGEAVTDLFITPGFAFRTVDGLLTNFHQPRSSLLVLLGALVGPRWRGAYEHALRNDYRFLSFGDCMLCWRAL